MGSRTTRIIQLTFPYTQDLSEVKELAMFIPQWLLLKKMAMFFQANHVKKITLAIPPQWLITVTSDTFKENFALLLGHSEKQSDEYIQCLSFANKIRYNILPFLKKLQRNHDINIVAMPMSNVHFPFVDSEKSIDLQIGCALAVYENVLAYRPLGILLSDSGYSVKLDAHFSRLGLKFYIVQGKKMKITEQSGIKGYTAVKAGCDHLRMNRVYDRFFSFFSYQHTDTMVDPNHFEWIDDESNLMNPKNDWIYPLTHELEEKIGYLHKRPLDEQQKYALAEITGSFINLQSKDWALSMNNAHIAKSYKLKWMKNYHAIKQKMHELISKASTNPIGDKTSRSAVFNYLFHPAIPASASHKPTLRILMLSWEYPPRIVGGLATAVAGLAEALSHLNVEVHVITSMAIQSPAYEQVNGVHIHRIHVEDTNQDQNFLELMIQLNALMVDYIEKLLDSGISFDMVHLHDWLVYFGGDYLKHEHEIPVVVTIHGLNKRRGEIDPNYQNKKIDCIEKDLIVLADHLIVCSCSTQKELTSIAPQTNNKISVIPNGIGLPNNHSERLDQQLNKKNQVILFVGRLVPEKGVDLFIRAAPMILAHHPHAKFVVIGEGSKLDHYKQLSMNLGLMNQIDFLGFVSNQLRDEMYRQADVCVFPSLYEPFGIVVLEAMSFGAPVVVSNTGGLKEIVHSFKNGLIMKKHSIDELASKVVWVLDHPKEAQQLAHQAYQDLDKKYSWVKIAKQTIALYQSLL
ncbi:glycosyltransferase [Hazenella sp. IB182357]|uniref:Glycosyltransferase n=1 Tax=Polycladospora coralii TaxID=2771432 RepID=A0A926RXL8_9BACL|nr:glycosyltransferase [Polycladospora coralii]MBD1372646.1 glycosyltransferase [Polycladospora coralii]MBS7531246.1 glycosyltransferase [Polycladospora coralii]